MVFVLIDEKATPVVIQGSATDDEPMPDAQPLIEPTWKEGILCDIELPYVFVETSGKKGKEMFKVLESKLRALEKAAEKPPTPLHPSVLPQGVPLKPIDWMHAECDHRRGVVCASIADLVKFHKTNTDGVTTFRQSPSSACH